MHHQAEKLCTNIPDLLGPQTCPHISATRKMKATTIPIKLNYKNAEVKLAELEFVLAASRVLQRSISNTERVLSTLMLKALWTNKPSCHIVTLCRRIMGKLS